MPYLSYYMDPLYFLILIAMLICMYASARVNGTYRKFDKVRSRSGYTGAQVADRMLRSHGIYDVAIHHVGGTLTDHYDPAKKTVFLSDAVYGSDSVAALGVAAHECGHVIQHAEGYLPLRIRASLVPVANFGSRFSVILIIAGYFFGYVMTEIGILLFAAVVLFHIVTLPVEFDASHRAMCQLCDDGILADSESGMTKKVLRAAAMTYVANTLLAVLQLLRLIAIYGGRGRRDR